MKPTRNWLYIAGSIIRWIVWIMVPVVIAQTSLKRAADTPPATMSAFAEVYQMDGGAEMITLMTLYVIALTAVVVVSALALLRLMKFILKLDDSLAMRRKGVEHS